MSDRIPVVYIMGSGRSGSTVLDTILGNHPRAASFGELRYLPQLGWREAQLCACGQRGPDCPFWSAVRARWEDAGGDLERYVELQERIERLRALPLLRWKTRERESWVQQTEALFRAVRDESGKPVVIDSSKLPARAGALRFARGLDVFYVHLVRDGRGVAWSLLKPYAKDEGAGVQRDMAPRSVMRTALTWTVINSLSARLLRAVPADRRARIRYEDYVQDPETALAPLEDFLGGSLSQVLRGEDLSVGHTIALGNRLRMSGRIRLRPDVEWRERMPEEDRRRVWRIAGGLMRRFGYAE